MTPKKMQPGAGNTDAKMEELRREREIRAKSYRERALKLFPWICGRCGREFEGKKIRELTVHHRDHNHDNNPPDGSNWELLCIYCHDNEHARYVDAQGSDGSRPVGAGEPSATFQPFADLASLLKKKK